MEALALFADTGNNGLGLEQNSDAAQCREVDLKHEQWVALEHLCRRAYWKRAWIVQEIVLARQIEVYCGENSVPWTTLQRFRQFARDHLSSDIRLGHSNNFFEASMLFRLIEQRLQRPNLSLGILLSKYCATAHCTDPRDKIYAFLGLAYGDRASHILAADYTKDTVQVYIDAMKFCQARVEDPAFSVMLLKSLSITPSEIVAYNERLRKIQPNQSIEERIRPTPLQSSTERIPLLPAIQPRLLMQNRFRNYGTVVQVLSECDADIYLSADVWESHVRSQKMFNYAYRDFAITCLICLDRSRFKQCVNFSVAATPNNPGKFEFNRIKTLLVDDKVDMKVSIHGKPSTEWLYGAIACTHAQVGDVIGTLSNESGLPNDMLVLRNEGTHYSFVGKAMLNSDRTCGGTTQTMDFDTLEFAKITNMGH